MNPMPNTASQELKIVSKLERAVMLSVKKKKGKCFCSLKAFRFCNVVFRLTTNNAHLVLTRSTGEPVFFVTSGLVGFKNSHKSTPLATRVLSLSFFESIQSTENLLVHVHMLGYGGRLRVFFSELRAFFRASPQTKLMWVSSIERLPLNGCRAVRRVL